MQIKESTRSVTVFECCDDPSKTDSACDATQWGSLSRANGCCTPRVVAEVACDGSSIDSRAAHRRRLVIYPRRALDATARRRPRQTGGRCSARRRKCWRASKPRGRPHARRRGCGVRRSTAEPEGVHHVKPRAARAPGLSRLAHVVPPSSTPTAMILALGVGSIHHRVGA